MLFTEDVVLGEESLEEVNYRLEEWRVALEGKGLKISGSKIVYIEFHLHLGDRIQRVNQNRRVLNLVGEVVDEVNSLST